MKLQYIKEFEKMGFGLFVHFGLYSVLEKGEWIKYVYNISDEEYEKLTLKFNPSKSWAKKLVRTAKKAGAKYITITTRHHDGFSLYDSSEVSNYDAPHSAAKRDLIREFVDECHKNNIKPFFYHTLLDWYNKDFDNDFPRYIDYLIKSVEILCKNYGEVGGFWFDGFWSKPDADWRFERLYGTIRKYQPNAMIINNTGLSALGEVSHYEIDAVTFERGKPFKVSCADGKERAGEVCDSITDHWGFARRDIVIKSISCLIDELIDCKRCGCNLLLNVGPQANGLLRPIEEATLLELGKWISINKEAVFDTQISEISSQNAIIFEKNDTYYAFIKDVPMSSNENVARQQNRPRVVIDTKKRIVGAKFLDDPKIKVPVDNKNKTIEVLPFFYGTSLYTRVLKFKLK